MAARRVVEFVQRYRLLLVIYVLGVTFGIREYMLSRIEEPVDWLSPGWAEMTDVVSSVNPDDPDTEFLQAMRSLAEGDPDEYVRRFEAALASGVKHNEFLLHDYSQVVLNSGADWQAVNRALNRWRDNYPFSAETIELSLGVGPRDGAEAATLRRELEAVEWIANARIESYAQEGAERWRAVLTFRPPVPVDMREAVAAASILQVPDSERARLRVVCSTLRDCRVAPR